jgi:hypothetical protein
MEREVNEGDGGPREMSMSVALAEEQEVIRAKTW